jgi:hypothetical protein
MIEADKIREFLLIHDYIVVVNQIDNKSCNVTYPLPITQKKRMCTSYLVDWDKCGVYVKSNTNDKTEFWSAPDYALRLMIACDITRQMKKLSLSDQAVYYYNKEDKIVNGIGYIIDESESEESRKKESFLHGVIVEAVNDRFTGAYDEICETHGIYTGYRLLKSFF